MIKTQKRNLFSNLLINIFGMEKSPDCIFLHPLTSFMSLKSTHSLLKNKSSYVKSMSIFPITYSTLLSYWLLLMVSSLLVESTKLKILNLPLIKLCINSIHKNWHGILSVKYLNPELILILHFQTQDNKCTVLVVKYNTLQNPWML